MQEQTNYDPVNSRKYLCTFDSSFVCLFNKSMYSFVYFLPDSIPLNQENLTIHPSQGPAG